MIIIPSWVKFSTMLNTLMEPSNNIPPTSLQSIGNCKYTKIYFLIRYSNQSFIKARMGMQSLRTTCMLQPRLISKDLSKIPLVESCSLNSEMNLRNGLHWRYLRVNIDWIFWICYGSWYCQWTWVLLVGYIYPPEKRLHNFCCHLSCKKYCTKIWHRSPTWIRSCQTTSLYQ